MSGRLPSLKPDKVIRVLERNGFWRITGRKKHRIYTDGEHIVLFIAETLSPGRSDPLSG